jgi:hypothetical protein
MQSLADAHDEKLIRELWKNIALYEEFEPLERLLAEQGETLQQALARYRVQNLARDYQLAPLFEATVWVEEIIRSDGEWTHSGDGVQELGANYFYLKQRPGSYQITLNDEAGVLEVWAIGVGDGAVEAIFLGSGGTLDITDYDYAYLMVFNPVYDNDVSDCTYYTYSLIVEAVTGDPTPTPQYTFSAEHFEPLAFSE